MLDLVRTVTYGTDRNSEARFPLIRPVLVFNGAARGLCAQGRVSKMKIMPTVQAEQN